jgi:low temperature requirement protein LtrA
VVLMALGIKKTLGHWGDPLHLEPAAALLGGGAVYLLALAAFDRRTTGSWGRVRIPAALLLAALIPAAAVIPALTALALLASVLVAVIATETLHPGSDRGRVRRELRH